MRTEKGGVGGAADLMGANDQLEVVLLQEQTQAGAVGSRQANGWGGNAANTGPPASVAQRGHVTTVISFHDVDPTWQLAHPGTCELTRW